MERLIIQLMGGEVVVLNLHLISSIQAVVVLRHSRRRCSVIGAGRAGFVARGQSGPC